MPTLRGACHCGNLSVSFETAQGLDAIEVRNDGCSFCRKHGATAVTDPAGRLTVSVRDGQALVRYRFGLGTADFLVCGRCGVYVAAVQTDGASAWATLNANVLDARARLTKTPVAVDYDGETAHQRRERRRLKWTPATVRVGPT